MLGRIASFVLSLCLMVNVSLGCAMASAQNAPQSGPASGLKYANNDCMQTQSSDDLSGKSTVTYAPFCKTFCASLMVATMSFETLSLGRPLVSPTIRFAAATWDSSVDPPHPRSLLNGYQT